ncbi:MAG: hypothetical protein A2V75_07535 [Actinobacteria bacterium RBG_16_70_17]|nr:MAG: hypothetical protein A2V75_07535 [Actinobacteria bacterium RBG_16_70_17]
MKRPLVYVTVWLAATAVAGGVAWAAVRLAGGETEFHAISPLSAREVAALATSTVPGATTTVPDLHTPSTTSTPIAATSTTDTPTTTSGSSATTAGAAGPTVVAHVVDGGTVVVSLDDGRLSLIGATPAQGFTVEVEESGPDEVVVGFDGAEADFEVRAFVSGGEVAFDVNGDNDGDDTGDDEPDDGEG